jgi:hypothetical protein
MLELCREVDLSAKPFNAQVGGNLGRKNLDDDLASEAAVDRHEYAAHPTPDELPLEAIDVAEGALEGRAKVRHDSLQGTS